jgi:hypothetical protein
MKLAEVARRYKWWLAAALLVYLGVSLWLFGTSGDPSDAPFVYLVF